MRFLYAAVVAFLVPLVVQVAVLLALGAPRDAYLDNPAAFVSTGLLASAPFMLMAAVRARAPGRRLAVWTGLGLTVLPWVVLIVDAVTAEPGRGANIGLAMIMFVWPMVVVLVMLGLSFVKPRRLVGAR